MQLSCSPYNLRAPTWGGRRHGLCLRNARDGHGDDEVLVPGFDVLGLIRAGAWAFWASNVSRLVPYS